MLAKVAQGIVLDGLDGVNGTIFAYGQTGSGKTFTITGGPQCYANSWYYPTVHLPLFSTIAQRSDCIHGVP